MMTTRFFDSRYLIGSEVFRFKFYSIHHVAKLWCLNLEALNLDSCEAHNINEGIFPMMVGRLDPAPFENQFWFVCVEVHITSSRSATEGRSDSEQVVIWFPK